MKLLLPFLSILILTSCSNPSVKETFNADVEIEKINQIMTAQEKAWSSGNMESYMQPYWNSDSLIFIGKRGMTYGWNTTLSNYKKSYKNSDEMGKLVFKNHKMESLSKDGAWVAGAWTLFRTADTLKGSYLLIWEKIDGEWKIIADHSS